MVSCMSFVLSPSLLSFHRYVKLPIGHAGHECVDYAAANVPGLIMAALKNLISTNAVAVDSVSTLLQSTLKSFDDSLISDLNSIHPSFPFSGGEHLSDLTDEQIRAIINDGDPETGLPNEEKGLKGENIQKVLRCMRGSTALVVLIDPKEENVWCCSLGDCVAGGFPSVVVLVWFMFETGCSTQCYAPRKTPLRLL
jgi:pyruvate dehydrogenase phosphatase